MVGPTANRCRTEWEGLFCPALGMTPSVMFGAQASTELAEAAAIRNLCIHEAAFLHRGPCERLIKPAR